MKPYTQVADTERRSPAGPAQPPTTGSSTRKLSPAPLPATAPLMTRADLAELLRTTPRQISNMTARGQLPAPTRVAGLGLRWRRAEIDAWIAAQ